jgi:hypothetical protein
MFVKLAGVELQSSNLQEKHLFESEQTTTTLETDDRTTTDSNDMMRRIKSHFTKEQKRKEMHSICY